MYLDRGFIKPSTEVLISRPRAYQALDRGFFHPSVDVFINPRSWSWNLDRGLINTSTEVLARSRYVPRSRYIPRPRCLFQKNYKKRPRSKDCKIYSLYFAESSSNSWKPENRTFHKKLCLQTLMTLPEFPGTKRNGAIYLVVGCNCKQWKLFNMLKSFHCLQLHPTT